jgi:DNA (cytosine-5)-methyltransferase 1
MRYASLCSGVGGLDLAVEEVFGAEVAWHAEVDKEACKVLAKHWPGTPNYGDITKIAWEKLPPVDLICAGPPCQPVSLIGPLTGHDDERFLWDEVLQAVEALRPGWVALENPPGIRPWLPAIFFRLAQMGYLGCYGAFSAAAIGACHLRERYFILAAHPDRARYDFDRGELLEEKEPRWWEEVFGDELERGPGGLPIADPDDGVLGLGAGGLDGAQEGGQPGPCLDGDGPVGGSELFGPVIARMPDGTTRDYGPALRQHAQVLGRPYPPFLHKGALNPEFLEWMMMFPKNWLVEVTPTAQRRLAGNAVVPPQAEEALWGLLTRLEPLLGSQRR